MWFYEVIGQWRYTPETGWFPTYAIELHIATEGQREVVKTFLDVSTDRAHAFDMALLLTREEVHPYHFKEVIRDLIDQ